LVEFSDEENTLEFCRVVRVTLPEPVRPETVTVKDSPFITLPESAPNWETATVRLAEAWDIITMKESRTEVKSILFIISP
jgi:hypothetical protein